jgi:hypothetical protein
MIVCRGDRSWLGRSPMAVLLASMMTLVGASYGAALALAADKKPKPPAPVLKPVAADDCAKATASANYVGYGYTHVVALKNGCAKPVECALWTDVDPDPRSTVRVAPGESAEVVTRRGSPAREVTAMKSCSYR